MWDVDALSSSVASKGLTDFLKMDASYMCTVLSVRKKGVIQGHDRFVPKGWILLNVETVPKILPYLITSKLLLNNVRFWAPFQRWIHPKEKPMVLVTEAATLPIGQPNSTTMSNHKCNITAHWLIQQLYP